VATVGRQHHVGRMLADSHLGDDRVRAGVDDGDRAGLGLMRVMRHALVR
jgi:hypothetical protein